ncbi:CoA transferase, partial [Pseudomonas sp. AFW1]|nr:CoA transferase [Pseudomonas sp. AFW1]
AGARPGCRWRSFVPRMDAVPGLGGDSDALLAELGCTAADIQRLRATGTV